MAKGTREVYRGILKRLGREMIKAVKAWVKMKFCKHELKKRYLGESQIGEVYSVRCEKCDYYHIEIEGVTSNRKNEEPNHLN